MKQMPKLATYPSKADTVTRLPASQQQQPSRHAGGCNARETEQTSANEAAMSHRTTANTVQRIDEYSARETECNLIQ